MDYLYTSYDKVDAIELEKNQVTTMTAYTPKLPMSIPTNQLEEVQKFSRAKKQYIKYTIMIYKGIMLLNNTGVLTNDIKEWNRKPEN